MAQPVGGQETTQTGASRFNPRAEAADLRDAFKGIGTNEELMIEILSRDRTLEQQQMLCAEYHKLTGNLLYDEIKDECSFNFKNAAVSLARPRHDLKATYIHGAMHRGYPGTHDHQLIDVFAFTDNKEMENIKHFYAVKYSSKKISKEKKKELMGKIYTSQFQSPQDLYRFVNDPSLEIEGLDFDYLTKDIESETSFNFKRVLVMLSRAGRDENPQFSSEEVAKDVDIFYKAGEGRLGTDDERFIRLLCTRSRPYIYEMDKQYQAKYGKTLTDVIKDETSGDFRDALLALVTDPATYFAQRAHSFMAGLGTQDEELIYLISAFDKAFLAKIGAKYQEIYGKKMEDDIKDDTSGNYRKLLLAKLQGGTYQVEAAGVAEITKLGPGQS